MDDQIFQALVGTVQGGGQPPGAVPSATVNALRQQHDLGQLYSMSPTLGKVGESMQTGALNSAKEIGDRRQQGLTRARQAEQDKLAQDKYDQTLKGYTDVKQYKDVDGKITTRGISKRTGQMEEIPEMAGLTEYSDPTKGKNIWKSKLATGEEILAHRDGTVTIPGWGTFASMEEAEADSLARMGEGKRNTEFQGQRGEDAAKEIQTTLDGHVETGKRLSNTANTLDNVLSALEAGAMSGNIADMFMTVDNATAQLESALAGLTLENLTEYKLTPVSDKDLEYVRKGAAPNLSAAGLKRWATHKKEAVKRMLEANAFMEDWVAANNRKPRGDDRGYLNKQVDKILHGENNEFEFAFDLDAEEKRDAKYRNSNITLTRPSWIKENDPRWDELSPEEKRQIIKAREG